jgi:hypothetical protein
MTSMKLHGASPAFTPLIPRTSSNSIVVRPDPVMRKHAERSADSITPPEVVKMSLGSMFCFRAR